MLVHFCAGEPPHWREASDNSENPGKCRHLGTRSSSRRLHLPLQIFVRYRRPKKRNNVSLWHREEFRDLR